ncbi:MAG TPA: chemotaxis protein CheA [Bryobacteraceae bacterium]|nr:chemotaxis protein CheA [Bryobacteraceae bacterium]
MAATNAELATQIERALKTGFADGSDPGAARELKQLHDVLARWSAGPHAAQAAADVQSILAQGVTSAGEQKFRAALCRLQGCLRAPASAPPVEENHLANDPELVQEFLVEARQHLGTVEAGVLNLEQNPGDPETLNGVFRSFHTIKGLAGFLGAHAIHELAHETENVLDLARSGQLVLTEETVDLILRAADELGQRLDQANTTPLDELTPCNPSLLVELHRIAAGDLNAAEVSAAELGTNEVAPETCEVAPAQAASSPQVSRAAQAKNSAEASLVRIDTAKLEYLIDMVGELVIAESVVRHDPVIAHAEDPRLSRNLTQLARVVQEVQKTSMSMRMVAVGSLFRKMNRLIRDLSRKSGKPVELESSGDDVELDRSIVEDLADPMVHMIRNAVDHGIETPEARRAAGKPEMGRIRLTAGHDAGDIVIQIADDGKGLDAARILAKARRLGLVGHEEQPEEESIFKLIFEPGFSTADKVTDMSGRGVGMDVVKKQIQKLRGRISIRSIAGKGCTFLLRLPLTLAIIDGLVVGVGSQRYILPMFAVREMFSPKLDTFVTLENRAEAALFRDKLLPVIRLSKLFKTGSADRTDGVLIVAEGRDQLYCIAVDQLIGKQEVVIKSLGHTLRDVPAISGGAILGDGRVGLIIDVNALRYQN